MENELETAYTNLHFGKQNKKMEQMAQNMLDKIKNQEIGPDSEDDGEEGSSDDEQKAQDFKQHAVPDEYKLFESVISHTPN